MSFLINSIECVYEALSLAPIFFSLKVVILLSFLLLMRGGTPRYRYDYLTKLGWLKFLFLSLSFLVIFILLTLFIFN